MSKFITTGIAVMVGILIYTRFTSSAHHFDWPRAIFIGLFTSLALFFYSRFKSKKASAAA